MNSVLWAVFMTTLVMHTAFCFLHPITRGWGGWKLRRAVCAVLANACLLAASLIALFFVK